MPKNYRPTKKLKSPSTWRSPLRIANFVMLFAIIGVLFLAFSRAATLAGFYGSAEQDQVNRINYTRGVNGKKGLQHIECLNAIAELWTKKMADSGRISHNPNLANEVSYACNNSWSVLGENVGVGYDSAGLFNAFMNSPAHKANILDSRFLKVGIGAYHTSDGRLWVTQIYAKCNTCSGKWATNATLPADPVKPATVIGNVDIANCRRIAGWTFDKESSSTSNHVHIYIDGQGTNLGPTAVYRGDVNSAYGISGNHGFDWTVPDSARDGKTHTAYIYGINVTGGPNVLIGQKTLDACASPIGNVDSTNCTNISGWAVDWNDINKGLEIHIYIDGAFSTWGYANLSRPDVNSHFSSYGLSGDHGFNINTPTKWRDGRQHRVDTYGINVGNGGNALIRTTTLGPCS